MQIEESQLYLKEETLSSEARQVKVLRKPMTNISMKQNIFFDDVCYQFHKNEQGNVYRSLLDEFSQHSRQVMNYLES